MLSGNQGIEGKPLSRLNSTGNFEKNMSTLNIKAFAKNYAIAYALIMVSFLIVISNIPLLDRYVTLPLYQTQCGDNNLYTELLKEIRLVLKESESCQLASPCVESQSLECAMGVQTAGAYISRLVRFVTGNHDFDDRLIARVAKVLRPEGLFIGYADKSKFLVSMSLFLIVAVYASKIIAALAAMYALWQQKLLRETFSFPRSRNKEKLLYPLLIAVISALVVMFLSNALNTVFPLQVPEELSSIFTRLSPFALILLTVVLAPLVEELVFRGVLLRFFIERNMLITGSILVSIGFSALHGFIQETLVWQLFASGTYFVLSMVMCWLCIKNKSLWSPIIFHAAYNAVLVSAYLLY